MVDLVPRRRANIIRFFTAQPGAPAALRPAHAASRLSQGKRRILHRAPSPRFLDGRGAAAAAARALLTERTAGDGAVVVASATSGRSTAERSCTKNVLRKGNAPTAPGFSHVVPFGDAL